MQANQEDSETKRLGKTRKQYFYYGNYSTTQIKSAEEFQNGSVLDLGEFELTNVK